MVSTADTAPAGEVILVRTHYFDSELAEFVARLEQAGRPVCLWVDELRGAVEVPDHIARLSLTPEFIQRMGLKANGVTGWMCGDYAFYAGHEKYPHAAHFWVVEPDLLINVADLRAFFDRFAREPEVDLIACNLRPSTRRWYWHGIIAEHLPQPWRCIFPIVRTSRRAVEAMLAARRDIAGRLTQAEIDAEPWRWPMDEAVTASACASAGYSCRDLNSFGARFHSRGTFSFDMPFSPARITRQAPDGRVYHPVLSGERFRAKIRRQMELIEASPSLELLSRLDRRVQADMAAECGEAEAAALAEWIEARARAIAPFAPTRHALTAFYRLRSRVRGLLGHLE